MWWLKSWPCWALIVVGCATWILPEIPYYQDWMPYGYELGGIALVVMYLSFGCWSLGLYSFVMGGLSWGSDSLKSRLAFKVGLAALSLAIGLVVCYLQLMHLTLSV